MSEAGRDEARALETLGQASAPLCNYNVAIVLMMALGMETDTDRPVKLISKRVGCWLRRQRNVGRVTSEEGPGQTVGWRLDGNPANSTVWRCLEGPFVRILRSPCPDGQEQALGRLPVLSDSVH